MESFQFACVLVIFLVAGISVCLSCDPSNIQRCLAPMQSMGQNTDKAEACRVIEKAVGCFQRELDSCPESMKSMLDMAKQSLDMAGKACDDPDAFEKEIGNVDGCKAEELEVCVRGLNRQGQSKAEACRNVGQARTCLNGFKDGCESNYLVGLITAQGDLLDQAAEICESQGYSTTGGNSGRTL